LYSIRIALAPIEVKILFWRFFFAKKIVTDSGK
jgi:hypothetical protein